MISIPITSRDENFEIELFDPEGGAKIGKVNRTAVTITNDDGKCNCCLDVKYRYHLLRFIDTIFYLSFYLFNYTYKMVH